VQGAKVDRISRDPSEGRDGKNTKTRTPGEVLGRLRQARPLKHSVRSERAASLLNTQHSQLRTLYNAETPSRNSSTAWRLCVGGARTIGAFIALTSKRSRSPEQLFRFPACPWKRTSPRSYRRGQPGTC